ncbi:autophagy-related protein 13-like [Saccoglossus kowalevskii]|uniref:Autophagy-related protein 13-like n=1 Tax=Saccoglossus kowalevskii TaxID=10224 RepID=A0ABM0M9X0_SACKO|nr:PREDICTED: autophagy-related protein 13-like [Saccoglossus kowalevskii]
MKHTFLLRMSTETKITPQSQQDKKDLEKFIKFLALKSIQVIVQSRLGNKTHTKCKPQSTGSDWFNLAIKDNAEVLAEAKKHISNQLPTIGTSMCVEVSLRTAEGDSMILEIWCLGMNDRCDTNAKVHYAVYNRMGLLLKSLICMCRVTPAYKLARKQGSDFGIFYRIFYGAANLSALGEGFESLRVGSVATPIGTITLTAAYRTKLAIPDRRASNSTPMAVKDDHFQTSPKRLSARHCNQSSSGLEKDVFAQYSVTQSQDLCTSTFSTSPPDSTCIQAPQTDCKPHKYTQPINVTTVNRTRTSSESKPTSLPDTPGSFSSGQKRGAFVTTEKSPPDQGDVFPVDIPFMSLLQEHTPCEPPKNKSLVAAKKASVDQPTDQTASTGSNKSNSSQLSATDDFVMVELKPAFAKTNSCSDLGVFYRECQAAAPLLTFDDCVKTENIPNELFQNELSDQLHLYEEQLFVFDDFVKSLQEDCSDSSS